MFCKLKFLIDVFYKNPLLMGGLQVFLSSVFLITPLFLRISRYFFSSSVRTDTPNHHQKKDNTPTMAGLCIGAITIGATFWFDFITKYAKLLIVCYLLFASIGVCDDLYKIYTQNGIRARTKFFFQSLSALIVMLWWFFYMHPDTRCSIPFLNVYLFDWGYFFIVWGTFVIVACSNAVNLTDGLDGLATVTIIPGLSLFVFFSYMSDIYDIAFFGVSLIASLLAFLVFNWYPAKFFMGDVGSLPLGAVFGLFALLLRKELLLPLISLVSVSEVCSVILQVMWYKTYKKRLFLMAPLHHHLELSGWHEVRITIVCGLISSISSLFVLFVYLYT